MIRIFVFLLFFSFSLSAQALLTAEDAIRLGLKNNFDIRIARNNAEIAANNRGLGSAGFYPVLDAAGNVQYLTSDQDTNSPFSFGKSDTRAFGGQLEFNWTLFDGFRMFIDKTKFNRLANLGEAQSRNVIENKVVSILFGFFNLVQQEQLLDVARSTLEISESRLNKEKVRRDVGGSSSTDLLNAQVSYNSDKAALLNQELDVLIARKELNILLGQSPETEIRVSQEFIVPPLAHTYAELMAQAEQRNSSLLVARESREIAWNDVNIAKSTFSPRLFLNASYVYGDRVVSSDSPRFTEDITTKSTDMGVGLTLSLNLFNGFRNRINLQNARLTAKNEELAYQNVRNQLVGLMKEKYETFAKQLALIELDEQNIIAARQNLQLQEDRYRIGATTSLEFRDAQVNLSRAQIGLIVVRYQARITRLEIEQLTGSLSID